MKNLDLNEDSKLLDTLLNDELLIIEDIQGSKIFANYDGENFRLKSKSMSNDDINLVDLAMQNYYILAVNYLNSLDDRVKKLLPKNWWFGFEYFPDNQPANIEYDRLPKNNLILTSIYKKKRFNYTHEELIEYSNLLDVDSMPIIFKGKLSNKMKIGIKHFINTSKEDLEYVFDEISFSKFFYDLLNPNLKNTFLMTNTFQENVEKIIIRSKNNEYSLSLLNPLYSKMDIQNNTEFVEVYSIILMNFLIFIQNFNIDSIKKKGSNRDEIYLNLICVLFNEYMSNSYEDLINYDFIIPTFFNKEKFRINKKLIKNSITLEYINSNRKIEYIFKVLLSSFKTKKKKTVGIFNDNSLKTLNSNIDIINNSIDLFIRKSSELDLKDKGLISFATFYDIVYSKDSQGNVYPEIWNDIVDEYKDKKDVDKKNDIIFKTDKNNN